MAISVNTNDRLLLFSQWGISWISGISSESPWRCWWEIILCLVAMMQLYSNTWRCTQSKQNLKKFKKGRKKKFLTTQRHSLGFMEAAHAHCHYCAYVSIYPPPPPYPQGLRWARKNWKRVKFISNHKLLIGFQCSCASLTCITCIKCHAASLRQTWLINQINKFYWKTNPRLNIVQESNTATVDGCSTSISLRSVCGFPDFLEASWKRLKPDALLPLSLVLESSSKWLF